MPAHTKALDQIQATLELYVDGLLTKDELVDQITVIMDYYQKSRDQEVRSTTK